MFFTYFYLFTEADAGVRAGVPAGVPVNQAAAVVNSG